MNTIIEEVVGTFRLRKVKEEAKHSENKEGEDELLGNAEIHELGDNFVKCIRDYEVFSLE